MFNTSYHMMCKVQVKFNTSYHMMCICLFDCMSVPQQQHSLSSVFRVDNGPFWIFINLKDVGFKFVNTLYSLCFLKLNILISSSS